MRTFALLINGELVEGAKKSPVINPANETVVAYAPRASSIQAEAAVAAAKAAFPQWAAKPLEERREALIAIADSIKANAEELARLLTLEQGKPLAESSAEVLYTEIFFRIFAGQDIADHVLESNEQRHIVVRRRPLGTVLAIVPWNFPLLLAASKVPQALLAGNTVILKPAPTTPLTSLMLGELAQQHLPPGVLNVLADDNDLGPMLTSHPDIAKVAFTGSTQTGRKVMASASNTIKRITLELGGNDPAIVLPDADVKAVAAGLFATAFANCGQVCMAVKRVYAHDSIYDELCEELGRLADAAIVGDGLADDTQVGPLQNAQQYKKLKDYLQQAQGGGKVVAGGQVIDGPGYFMRPTIVRDITDGHPLVDEEQFGPILPIVRYADVEDALARSNDSQFGLGASVWGQDLELATSIASRLEAGNVWINKHMDFGPTIPFAGAKQSGLGVELAQEGLEEFTQIQVINAAR